MKQRRGREVQAPRDRRGAPGRQTICFPGALLFPKEKPNSLAKSATVGFTIIYVIVNLQMLFRVLHIPADLLGVAVLLAEDAAAILLHI